MTPPPTKKLFTAARLRAVGKLLTIAGLAWAAVAGVDRGVEYATTSARFAASGLYFAPTRNIDDDTMRELLAIAPNTNILSLDEDKLRAQVEAHPWVRSAEVEVALPDAVRVTVHEHKARATLAADELFLIDDHGVAFKAATAEERVGLPIVTGIDAEDVRKAPQVARARVKRALELLESYAVVPRPEVGEVHVGPRGELVLYTAREGTQVRLGRGDPAAALQRWDVLREGLGPRASALAIVHADAAPAPNGSPRIVASFFSHPHHLPQDGDGQASQGASATLAN